ncbi:hypothetical protein [Lutibacter sp.]
MAASSYIFLREIGAFIIWVYKGFKGDYSAYRRYKYSSEIGLAVIVFVISILFITQW